MPLPPQAHHYGGRGSSKQAFGNHAGNLLYTNSSTHTHHSVNQLLYQTCLLLESPQVQRTHLAVVEEALTPTQQAVTPSPRCSHSGEGDLLLRTSCNHLYLPAKKKWVGMVATVSNLKKSLMQGAGVGWRGSLDQLLSQRCIRSDAINY